MVKGPCGQLYPHGLYKCCWIAGFHAPRVVPDYFMANDYGYENVFSTSLDKIAKKDDILIAVSSSGISINVVNGVNTMKRLGGKVLTFSGFDKDNTLRQLGDLNVW